MEIEYVVNWRNGISDNDKREIGKMHILADGGQWLCGGHSSLYDQPMQGEITMIDNPNCCKKCAKAAWRRHVAQRGTVK